MPFHLSHVLVWKFFTKARPGGPFPVDFSLLTKNILISFILRISPPRMHLPLLTLYLRRTLTLPLRPRPQQQSRPLLLLPHIKSFIPIQKIRLRLRIRCQLRLLILKLSVSMALLRFIYYFFRV